MAYDNPSTFAQFGYVYDNEGNKLYENKSPQAPTQSEGYQYDATYRLINYQVGTLVGSTITVPSTQTSYSLDPVGNWNSKTTNGVPQTRVHNADNELIEINSTGITYDADGNTLNDGAYIYAHDEENRLTSVTRVTDSAVVGQYQYDALSRRVQTIADPAGTASTTLYFYDMSRIVEEQNSLGVTAATYVYGNYVDEVLTMDVGGNTYYYHQNALWSVEAITDSTATPVERYAYDAYGYVTITNGTGTPVPLNVWGTPHSAIGNPWMFTGRELDEETGLYYYRARYYDAGKGRFLQRDPLEDVDGPNLYEYVADNPTHYVDPTGTKAWWEKYDYLCCRRFEKVKDVLAKFKLTTDNQNCTCRNYMMQGNPFRSVWGLIGTAGVSVAGLAKSIFGYAGAGMAIGDVAAEAIAAGYCEGYWCSDFYVPVRTTVPNPKSRVWNFQSKYLATYTCNQGGSLYPLNVIRYSEVPRSLTTYRQENLGTSYTVGESSR
jgi:RHS repeat-associated protein